jgi:hypothetical protein
MANIKVRVGQQNSTKVIASLSGSAGGRAIEAKNVIGGIASVTQLYVSGISTFVGVSTFNNSVFISGDLYIRNDLTIDELTARNVNVTGITTTVNLRVTNSLYYTPSYTSGVAYFDSTGLMVSTGATSSAIDYTNYLLTTNNAGIPVWSNTIDGGVY